MNPPKQVPCTFCRRMTTETGNTPQCGSCFEVLYRLDDLLLQPAFREVLEGKILAAKAVT